MYSISDNEYKGHSELFFEKMSDKWSLFILKFLNQNKFKHFNGLKREIKNISAKVLAQKLKNLERDGFITRHIINNKPIRVEYRLTSLGEDFATVACLYMGWVEQNIDHIIQAQSTYDQHQSITHS